MGRWQDPSGCYCLSVLASITNAEANNNSEITIVEEEKTVSKKQVPLTGGKGREKRVLEDGMQMLVLFSCLCRTQSRG